MKKQKVQLLMDEKRNLYIVDADGVEYNLWVLGMGVPASLVIETDDERAAKDKKQKELEQEWVKESELRHKEREARKTWWDRFMERFE